MPTKSPWNLLKATCVAWWQDDAVRLGASLAYYTVFSAAPLLVFAVMLVSLIYGQDAAQGRVAEQLSDMMGPEVAEAVEAMIASTDRRGGGVLATILSLEMLLFGASAVFTELNFALNKIWKVGPAAAAPWWNTIFKRLQSFLLVLVIGVLFLALVILHSTIAAASDWLATDLPFSSAVIQTLNYLVTIGIETLLFALIFKFLPVGVIAWRDVWLGAFVTAILFGIGNTLIGFYVSYSAVGSAYGAAGSLAVFMLWAYYSAQIVYLGAEFTQTYARMYGSQIVPESAAAKRPSTGR